MALTFFAESTEPSCAQVKPTARQTTVTVDADTVYMTIPYGVDAEHVQIAVGAIAK